MPRPLRSEQSQQLNLFHRPPEVPFWETIPVDVRQRAIALIARLLQDHGFAKRDENEAKGVRDE